MAPSLAHLRAAPAAALAALLLAAPLATAAQCGATVLSQDFSKYSGKGYKTWGTTAARADFVVGGGERRSSGGSTLTPGPTSVKGADNVKVGDGAMRLDFPKGCVGAQGKCGLIMYVRLPRPVAAATLSYNVKFSAGYDWTYGGKLPGLCSEECPVGCQATKGSFSSRVMWRRRGGLVSYQYYDGKKKRCGVDAPWRGATIAPGRWSKITVYMRVNTPGKANGVEKAWLDGRLVYSDTGIRFRTDSSLIEKLALHTYHGGRGSNFAPDRAQTIWLDDVKVSEGECPPGARGSAAPVSIEEEEEEEDADELVAELDGDEDDSDGDADDIEVDEVDDDEGLSVQEDKGEDEGQRRRGGVKGVRSQGGKKTGRRGGGTKGKAKGRLSGGKKGRSKKSGRGGGKGKWRVVRGWRTRVRRARKGRSRG